MKSLRLTALATAILIGGADLLLAATILMSWLSLGIMAILLTVIAFVVPVSATPISIPSGLYGISGEVSEPQLILIDTTTGEGTPIVTLDLYLGDAGLAYDPHAHVFYGVTIAESVEEHMDLFSVDTAGHTAVIGSLGLFESDSGLAFNPWTKTLYMTGEYTDSLYTINTTTGEATLVGELGLNIRNSGLAFDPLSNTLYGITLDGSSPSYSIFYTINPPTGLATIVNDEVLPNHMTGLTFDPIAAFANRSDPANPSDTLFASNSWPVSKLYSVNPEDGSTDPRDEPIGFNNVEGLAFKYEMSDIPEPSTLILLSTAAFGLLLFARQRRRGN